MSEIDKTANTLRGGVEALNQAAGPLETGRANADTLYNEIQVHRTALCGIITFFRGLEDRVKNDIEGPYRTAEGPYRTGVAAIMAASTGATYSQATAIRELGTEANERLDRLLAETATLQNWSGIDFVLNALVTAKEFTDEIARHVSRAELTGDVLKTDLYPPLVERTERYIDTL